MNPQSILRRVWGQYQTLTHDEYNYLSSAYQAAGHDITDETTAIQMCLTLCGLYGRWLAEGSPREASWFLRVTSPC
jgi:hypothetical protein